MTIRIVKWSAKWCPNLHMNLEQHGTIPTLRSQVPTHQPQDHPRILMVLQPKCTKTLIKQIWSTCKMSESSWAFLTNHCLVVMTSPYLTYFDQSVRQTSRWTLGSLLLVCVQQALWWGNLGGKLEAVWSSSLCLLSKHITSKCSISQHQNHYTILY